MIELKKLKVKIGKPHGYFQYDTAEKAEKIPMGETIRYASYVMTPGFRDSIEKYEALCEDVWGVKDRTARGYAVILTCLEYIYERNITTFDRLGHSWEEFLNNYMPNIWGPVVKLCHLELTRSDVICKTYIRDVIKIISRWKMEDLSF